MAGARGRKIGIGQREQIKELISQATENGSRLSSTCLALGISTRTVERWKKFPEGDLRRGPITSPANRLSDDERKQIIEISCRKEFVDKSPCQIVPMLADRGVYIASEATFYRVLKLEQLHASRGEVGPKRHSRPQELIAAKPNQVWSWDITYLKTSVLGRFFYLYLVLDIYSRKILGFEIAEYESSELAAKMVSRLCKTEQIERNQLYIHSDNGGPMKGATMLATLRRLGVIPSFSRPSVSDDNAFSESLFKTLKYHPHFPKKPFESLGDAKRWVEQFIRWYNTEHLHSGIGFITPLSRHEGHDGKILEARRALYETMRSQNPERWSGKIRNWKFVPFTVLNSLPTVEAETARPAA